MNNSYRSLWNAALASWVAVPETARACGAGTSSSSTSGRVSRSPWRRTLLALALVGAWAGQAQAATKYWDVNGNAVGIGGAGTWTPTPNFWNSSNTGMGGIPSGWNNAALDDAFFSSVFGYTVNLGAPATVHNLDFGNGVVLTGSILTLGGPAPTINVVGGSSTINSTIAGTAGVIKTGTGYLVLGGTNTFTGGLSVNGGQLHLTGANSANGANNVVTVGNGADLVVNTNSFGGDTAAARLVLNSGSALTLLHNASFTHDLTLGGGIVSIDVSGSATWNGTAVLTADTTLNFNGQNLTVTGNLRDTAGRVLSTRYAASGYTNTVTGNQSYSGGTVVTGPGTTIFSGTNTYFGDTLIEGGGLLVVNGARAHSDNSNVVLGSANGSGILSLGTGNASFTESLGIGGNQVRWGGDGGFYARIGSLLDAVVNLNGGSPLTWGAGYFIGNGRTLILGTEENTPNARQLDFRNDIDLGAGQRSVRADNGILSDHALISGRLSGAGGGLTVTGNNVNVGLLELSNNGNSYGGPTVIGSGLVGSGSLLLSRGGALPGGLGVTGTAGGNSNLRFNGGVLLLSNGSGGFERGTGIAGHQVQWLGSGGFAATGSTQTVNLGGAGGTLSWNSAGFVPTGQSLILGSVFGNATVDFRNRIDLNGATRSILIGNGLHAIDAILSGTISGNGGLVLTGPAGPANNNGTVELTGLNSFTGNVTLGDAVNSGSSVTARVSQIGMAGANGNLGAGNTIVLSSHNGGVTYTGVGETTNRTWMLSGGSTWQYYLTNNGTGSLNLSGNIIKDATGSTNIFHLGGSYTGGTNILSGVISENGGAQSLLSMHVHDGTWRLTGTNSYSGITTISGGVLEITDLQNGGVASGLGDSSNAPGNLSFVAYGGTLRYRGAGGSTDRLFSPWNSGRIESSGSGPIAFTNTGTLGMGQGQYIHWLGGDNAGHNTFAPSLINGLGNDPLQWNFSLGKDGPGQWALVTNSNALANAYTGNTTISGGALRLDHAGAVTGGLGVNSSHGAAGSTQRSSLIQFSGAPDSGAVLGLTAASGDFTRGLTTATASAIPNPVGVTSTPTQDDDKYVQGVRWLGSGGFAAFGVDRSVNLGGAGAGVTWDAGGFVPTGQSLILGYVSADRTVDFVNPIDLGTIARTVNVANGGAVVDAVLSGVLSDAGALIKEGTGTLALTADNTYGGTTTVNAGTLQVGNGGSSGTLGAGNVSVANAGTLAYNLGDAFTHPTTIANNGAVNNLGSGTLTLPWPITGAGTVNQNGSGTMVLAGTHTYTGRTTVNAGTLRVTGTLGLTPVEVRDTATLDGTGRIGGGVVVRSGGTFAPGGAATPGGLTVGSLVLDAGSQTSYRYGAPDVVGGPLNDLTSMPGSLSLGGTLNIIDVGDFSSTPGSYRVFNYGGTLTNPAGLALGSTPGHAPGDVVVQTSVAGQVNLIVSQAGLPISHWDGPNVTANGRPDGGTDAWNNTTSNWTNTNGAINQNWIPGFGIFAGTAGIVTLAENVKVMGLQFTTDGYVVRGAGNTIDLIGMPSAAQSLMRVDAGVTATLATSLVGTGGLEKKDAGTLVLSGANTYGGGTTVTAGRLQVGDGGATGNLPGDVVNNAELMFKRGDTTTYAGIVSGTGKFVQAGSGNLTLTGANTYTGGTLVSAGTLTGNTTSLQGPIVTEATLAFDQATAGTFGAPISGAGELVKLGAGNLTLTGTHSYSGGTVVKAGTLTGTTGSLQGAIVNLADVVFDQPGSGTYAGVMSGTGNLTKAGAGVLTLTGTSTYAGHTALVGGSMWVNGALANTSAMTASNGTVLGGSGKIAGLTTMAAGSTLSPGTDAGAIGHLSLGALILTPASTLDFDLSKPNVIGPQNDRIDVDGNLTLAGTLHVTDGGQFASMPGSYRLINYGGTLTGNAASLALGTTPGYAPGDVLVQTSVPHQVNLIAKLPGLGLNFWDGRPLPSSLHNGAIEGGDGVWNNVASSWVDKVADFNSPWLPGMAIFSGAKGTVSLGENVDTMAMQFITDGYVIEGAGHTLRLLGMQGGSAPSLIRVDPGTTATIAANMIGTAGMLKGDTGTLVLSGANSYSGNTLVTGGTLKAGALHTLSAVSAHAVSLGTTLDTAGFDQRIAGLTNAGTVSLQSAAPGSTLTVTGPYVGNNGVLRLGAVLGVDGRSDRLVLDGPGATASGRTTVQVTNLGGLGGPTVGNGIEVVTALNGATTTAQTTRDAFVLAGSTVVGGVKPKLDGVLHATHVDAGAYEYYLHAADADGAGENWYLRSARPAVFLGDVTPIGEDFRSVAGLPTYRVEVPLFAALPHQLRQGSLAMLGNMHQRIGDEVQGPGQGERHAWARVITTNIDMQQGGTVRPVSDGRVSGLQAGTDLWAASGWRAGVYGGQLEGDVNVRGDASGVFELPVGANDLRSQFVGVYGTYMNGSGFYADTVLQAGRHRYTVKPVNLRATSGKGDGLLASIEVGQSLGLGEGWMIEPQLQIIHQQMDLDDVDIPGANVHQSVDSGWMIRVGARVKGDVATAWGRLQPYGRFNVYRSAGGTDVARFTGPGAFADIASLTGSISSEFAGGATLTVGKHVDFYGEAGTLWAHGGHGAKVRSSLRASAGVRMRW